MKYKTKNARRGARALKQYHKSKKRKILLQEKPDIIYWMAGIAAVIAGIAMNITDSYIISLLLFNLCVLLDYLWAQGKIL